MITIESKLLNQLVKHAKKETSREVCGILVGKNSIVEQVYQMQNISDSPQTCYFMKPEEQLKVFKELRKLNLEMLAIYHSHIDSPAYPSAKDMELAFYPEVVHIIISLQNFVNPDIKGFKIIENKIKDERIEVKNNES
jgi:proteasome lid subunit RPN8/RPN11